MENKYAAKLTPYQKEQVKNHIQNNFTATEIAKIFGITPQAVRGIAKKNNLTLHVKEHIKSSKNCAICNAVFHENLSRKTTCSPKCSSIKKHKERELKGVSQEQINQVLELKKLGTTNEQIRQQTGLTKHTLKKICKDNNIFATPETISKNLSEARQKADLEVS